MTARTAGPDRSSCRTWCATVPPLPLRTVPHPVAMHSQPNNAPEQAAETHLARALCPRVPAAAGAR